MVRVGLFGPDERVELVEGVVVRGAISRGPRESPLVRTRMALLSAFATTHQVRCHMEMAVGRLTQVRPDFVMVPRDDIAAVEDVVEKADLVVEVVDTLLDFCRHDKASLYARAEVEEYWVVNVFQHCLEVYRKPRNAGRTGWGYGSRGVLWPADSVMPLSTREFSLRVADLV